MSLVASSAPSEALVVEEMSDRTQFVGLSAVWDELAKEVGGGPFLRHAFIRIWLDNFAPRDAWRILLVRDRSGALCGALPLVARRTSLYGIPVRELSATANSHSCRFDLLATEPVSVAAALWSHLCADESWDVLRLTDIPAGGAAEQLSKMAGEAGWPVGKWESLQSPYLFLPREPAALEQALSSKFRANLRRRRRKLEERGRVEIERVAGGLQLAARLEEGLALEASGWKGRRGTAIAQSDATWGFYSELAREAAREGTLRLAFLRLDGRAVAFQYALEREGRLYLLKPAYDESVADCSPGQLLLREVLDDAIGRGLTEFDFLGPDMAWKRDWTDKVRVHTWLYVFRNSRLGTVLREIKFRWGPMAKETLARWRP